MICRDLVAEALAEVALEGADLAEADLAEDQEAEALAEDQEAADLAEDTEEVALASPEDLTDIIIITIITDGFGTGLAIITDTAEASLAALWRLYLCPLFSYSLRR